jgi:uncharacterized membrane protein YgcG
LATESLETSIKSLDDAVKTFALHPTGDYLALINGKGDLLIYRLVSEKGPLGKHYIGSNLVLNQNVSSKLSSRDFEEGFRISWRNSSGNSPLQLCIPQHDGFPMIFTRHSPASAANSNDNEADSSSSTRNETWDDNTILTSDAYEQTLSHCREYVNLVCFSPNGKYLASADRTGKVLIWDIPTKDAITSYQCHDLAEIPQQLLDLQWGSCDGDNYLIVLSQVGVAKIDNVINTTLGHPLPTGEYSEVPLTSPPLPVAKAPAAAVSSLQSHSAHKRIKKSVGFGADEKDDDDDFDFTDTLQKSSTLQSDLSPTPSSSAFKGTVIQDEDDDETNSLPAPPPPAAAAVPTAAVTSAGAARGRSAAGKAVPTARSLTETEAYEDDDDLSDDLEGVDLVTDGMDEFLVDDPHHPHRLKKNNKTLSLSSLSSSLSSLLFHQAPFQSSSTTYDERRRRYLVWNSVGSMITRDEDIGNRIEIKFADNSSGSYHKNEHFNDNYGFELGDLSAHGALFATLPEEQIEPSMTPSGAGAGAGGGAGGVGLGVEDEEDEDLMTTGGGLNINKTKRIGSILFYKSFYSKIETGYFANENFTHSFPYHEVVRCVTTSLGWCAVVTSTNSLFYLRIFSTAGIQLHLSLLKGAVVTMCSSLHNLAIIYNSSTMVSKSSPYLLVDLYYITPITRSCDSSSSSGTSSGSGSGTSSGSGVTGSPLPNLTCLLSQCILPLSAMSSLQWISFSNNSQLVSLDTSGQLLMLFTFSSCASSSTTSQWIPVMNTNQLKKNLIDYHLYPITVKTDKLCYVLLNGQKRPSIHPQPVVTAKSFSLPVLELKEKDHGGVSRSSAGGSGGGAGGGGGGGGGVNGTDRIRDALWLSLSLTHHQHTLESHLLSGYPLPYLTPITTVTSGGNSSSSSSNLETCSLDEVVSQELIGMDKLLLKLFYECCKKQRVAMALDVMGRMVTTDALESAIKVANHFSKASLAMILSEILNEKRRGEDKTHERDSRSLEREFESEVHSHSHSNSYSNSHSNRRTSASASVVSGGGRPGIASYSASSQQQGQGKGREEEESQFQLAQSSYVSSSQSYEYAPSSQAQEVVEEEEEEDGFLSHRHSSSSVLSKKPLITQAPLFSSSSSPSPTAAPGSEERPKTIPVNKFVSSLFSLFSLLCSPLSPVLTSLSPVPLCAALRFAQSQMSSPSKKKRSIHESLAQDLKGSPSPKKATLSVRLLPLFPPHSPLLSLTSSPSPYPSPLPTPLLSSLCL